jgi:DNA polymerase III subunit alpha
MDIFEFELRYLSYKWLSLRLNLNWNQEELLQMVRTSWLWQLTKKLTETTPSELKELTLETYTSDKKTLIENYETTMFGAFSVADYIRRTEYELKVVKEMGYNTYFLIVQDFINRAKNNWVAVGPGRWSAAGSLMAWSTRITDVDPFPYGLLFERFLNPARISMPDIDIDFEDEKRYDVVRYVRKKYGEERFAHIGTFMTLAARAAFKDVARTMGMPFERSNALTELISEKTIKESMKARDELQTLYETDDLVKKTLDAAMKLEWNIRQTGVHACGMIIAPQEVVKYTSVQYPPNTSNEDPDQSVVTQFDYHALEDLWLLKMDFLGLRTLGLIKNTVKIVKARLNLHGSNLPRVMQHYLDTMTLDLPLDDPLPYEKVLQKWDTSWIFQFEWSWIRNFLVQLKPNTMNDIAAMSALYRPGPIEFIPNYIHRKHGDEKVFYMLPELEEKITQLYGKEAMEADKQKLFEDLDPILGDTYGIAVYQEQLMFLVQSMAGFSLAEADTLRRGIGKKIKSEIERIKWIFVTKAAEFRDYKPETASFVYEKLIEPAAAYSFNKSHAVAYWLISYQTAWLKAHYPIEFNAALLRSEEENPDKLAQFISELQIQWYRVLPPHINESFTHVAAIDNTIRLGFLSIKWVWSEVSERIEEERKTAGAFASFEDFISRCSSIITKKTIESLAKAGAFTGLVDRKTVLDNLQKILDWSKSWWGDLSAWLFGGIMKPVLSLVKSPETSKMEKLLMEYDVFKTFVSWHPFDGLYQYVKKRFSLISAIKQVEQAGDIKILCYVKNIQRAKKKWFFVKVEDLSDEMEFFVKDYFDRQKFDILILEWFKGKRLQLSKITRTTLDFLMEDATRMWQYDPQESIADVKAKRLGKDFFAQYEKAQELIEEWAEPVMPTTIEIEQESMQPEEDAEIADFTTSDWDIVPVDIESFVEPEIHEEEVEELPESILAIQPEVQTIEELDSEIETCILPADLQDMQKCIQIIKKNPWEKKIRIGERIIEISDKWYEQLQSYIQEIV